MCDESEEGRFLRHQASCECQEEQGPQGEKTSRDSDDLQASQEATQDGKIGQDESDEIEHPSKSPHVEVVSASGVVSVVASQSWWGTGAIIVPGVS